MVNFEKTYKKQVKKKLIITKNELSKDGSTYKLPFYLLDVVKL
jgi:hypothetical protein